MSVEGGSSGESGAGTTSASSAGLAAGGYESMSAGGIAVAVAPELSTYPTISESVPSSMEVDSIETQHLTFGGFDEPALANSGSLSENPFDLPVHRVDLEQIAQDTTRRFPQLAFNRDLYQIDFSVRAAHDRATSVGTATPKPENLDIAAADAIETDILPESSPFGNPIANTKTEEATGTDILSGNIQDKFDLVFGREAPTFSIAPNITEVITPAPIIISERTRGQALILKEHDQTYSPPLGHAEGEETGQDQAVLASALIALSRLDFSLDQKQIWREKLQRAIEDPSTIIPEPGITYDLTFGKVEAGAQTAAAVVLEKAAMATPEAEPENNTEINSESEARVETGLIELTEAEEEVEITDQDLKKKVVKIPEDSYDRYEITERDQTAYDVQERRKELAKEAAYSAINTDGVIETDLLGEKLSQLDIQTPAEKLRISEGTLQVPDVSGQAKASITGTQTPDQALSTIIKVIAQNEARDLKHEITSHQILPFDRLDRGAQEVITNLQAENVIRPLIWEPADKLPLRNPVEIGRNKKAA